MKLCFLFAEFLAIITAFTLPYAIFNKDSRNALLIRGGSRYDESEIGHDHSEPVDDFTYNHDLLTQYDVYGAEFDQRLLGDKPPWDTDEPNQYLSINSEEVAVNLPSYTSGSVDWSYDGATYDSGRAGYPQFDRDSDEPQGGESSAQGALQKVAKKDRKGEWRLSTKSHEENLDIYNEIHTYRVKGVSWTEIKKIMDPKYGARKGRGWEHFYTRLQSRLKSQVPVATTGAQGVQAHLATDAAYNEAVSEGLPVVFHNSETESHQNSYTGDLIGKRSKSSDLLLEEDESSQNRRDIVDIIQAETETPTNTTTAELKSSQAQFQKYLDAYASIQANISALVYPVIKDIITANTDNVTNSTWVHNVAMGAYVDIVGLPIIISGPFIAGMNCLGWLEKQYFNGTNNTVASVAAKSNYTDDDIDTLRYFATYEKLFYMYENAWLNGTAAANSTGLLNVFRELERRLATNNTAIMPKNFLENVNGNLIDELFLDGGDFTIY